MDIEKLKNSKVNHIRFGAGIVVDTKESYINIEFSDGTVKMFRYPDAFENFLKAESEELQGQINQELEGKILEADYTDCKKAGEVLDSVREHDRQRAEEQERKRLAQLERQRQAEQLRMQKMQDRNRYRNPFHKSNR